MSETKFEFYSEQHGAETVKAVDTIFADGAELERGIFINAPCACGKSYFVQHDLVRYAATHGHRILHLVSRTPLKDQLVYNVGFKNLTITVTTYQHFEQAELDETISDFDIIVCDEAHYFVSDSAFNGRTVRSLERIFAQPAVKIFMTATPIPSHNTFKKIFPQFKFVKFKGSTAPVISDVKFFEDNFDGDTEADIELLLAELDKTEDKAIIFCRSVHMARELYQQREDESMFLCSKSTNNKKNLNYMDDDAVKALLENEKFDCKYLFTTSVAEVGITIHDKQVKHIVCSLTDWNSIVQAIGRKRMIDDTDKVTVYLADRTPKSLTASETNIKMALRHYNYYKKHGAEKYAEEFWHEYDTKGHIVWKEPLQPVEINPLALAKWEREKEIIKEIHKTKKGKESYQAWVYKQLGLAPIEQRKPDQLQQVLEPFIDIPLTYKQLRTELAPRINYTNDNNRDHTGCKSLNNFLKATQTPMLIEEGFDKAVRRNTYTLRRIA